MSVSGLEIMRTSTSYLNLELLLNFLPLVRTGKRESPGGDVGIIDVPSQRQEKNALQGPGQILTRVA